MKDRQHATNVSSSSRKLYTNNITNSSSIMKKTNIVLKLLYLESMDLIFGACEDSSIYVWGFDHEAVKLLKNMKITTSEEEENKRMKFLNDYYMKLNSENLDQRVDHHGGGGMPPHPPPPHQEALPVDLASVNDSVTNRVAGYVLKKILSEHNSCVTSLAVVERKAEKFLLSAGWDRRICIWELESIRLYDIFRNKNAQNFDEIELASDGYILDMCYSPKLNQFAYACSDTMCYIRNFSKHGPEMKLNNTLQGHLSEVNCIKWHEGEYIKLYRDI